MIVKRIRFFRNFPLGLFVGSVGILVLLWVFDSSVSEVVKDLSVKIFLGLVGLIASTLALYGVLTSIENQNVISETNRLQELAAWRSTLPLALSKLISISRDGMAASVRQGDAAHWLQADLNARLDVSSSIMETLRNCIKSSDEESRKWLSVVVGRYQIYRSRSDHLMSQGTVNYDLALDWATFHALVEHCYQFARGATLSINPIMGSDRINSAFFLNDIDVEDDADFAKLVRRRIERYGNAPVSVFEFNER